MFASLVALDSFHLLLSTKLTADLTPEWSDGSMFYPLSHIYAKTHFCYAETVGNNDLIRRRVVVFDRLWENVTPTLNTAFLLTNVQAKWWIHCLLISQLLSYLAQLEFTIGQNEFFFLCVFRDSCRIWATWAFSIIYVYTTVFKVSIPPLNRCFRRSRVWIKLINLLFCLNSIFPIRKQYFINTRNSDFSIVLKICNSGFI